MRFFFLHTFNIPAAGFFFTTLLLPSCTTHLQVVVLSLHQRGSMLSIVLFHIIVHAILIPFSVMHMSYSLLLETTASLLSPSRF